MLGALDFGDGQHDDLSVKEPRGKSNISLAPNGLIFNSTVTVSGVPVMGVRMNSNTQSHSFNGHHDATSDHGVNQLHPFLSL